MSFPWYEPARTPPRGRDAMFVREIEERAALLYRLGFPKARARARIAANVAWDFEVGGGAPPASSAIDAAVDEVYRRGGVRHGAPTV